MLKTVDDYIIVADTYIGSAKRDVDINWYNVLWLCSCTENFHMIAVDLAVSEDTHGH